MPLSSKDAERLLDILWDAKIKNLEKKEEEGEEYGIQSGEEQALSNAISMLHCFVTDIAPTYNPANLLHNSPGYYAVLQVLNGEADVQDIELSCSTTRDPGLHFECYMAPDGGIGTSRVVYVSHIEKGTVADRAEIFRIGDVVLTINGHSLTRVSLEKIRWLMKSAARSGKITLSLVTCDGRLVPVHVRKNFKTSQSAHQQLHYAKPERIVIDSGRRPSYTPSIGAHHSDHKTVVDTVGMAAQIGRDSFRFTNNRLEGKKKHRMVKVILTKENNTLGLRLTGGRGSRFGDIGIYICSVEEGGAAYKEGSLRKGDEILMINNRNVVGLRISDVTTILKEEKSEVTIIAKSKSTDDELLGGYSSVSLDPRAEPEVNKLLEERQTLDHTLEDEIEQFIDGKDQSFSAKKSRVNSTSAYDLTLKPHQGKRERMRRASDQPVTSTQMIELDEFSSPKPLATIASQPITQWGRLSTNKLQQPSTKQAVRTIVFVKAKGKPLGFSLCGGRGSKIGDIGIYVTAIQLNGEAAKDGRLKVGDEIVSINEEQMENYTHKVAARKIKSLQGVVSLKIRSNPEYTQVIKNRLQKHSSVRGTPITVTLDRGKDEELGLAIAGLTDDRDEYGIFVKHIQPYSPADRSKLLHRADQLVSINGKSLLHVSIEDAMQLLSPNELPTEHIVLQFIRPKQVDALMKLLTTTSPSSSYTHKWQGSFRMKERESYGYEEDLPDTPLSPLDKDILNLFTTSETDLATDPAGRELQETAIVEFPAIAEELKTAQERDGGSILCSMTPILSRPSIARQYSNPSSPSSSPRVSRDMEMKTKRESGLITSHDYHQETSFQAALDVSSDISPLLPRLQDMTPPTIRCPDRLPSPPMAPPDTPPMAPPDMPPMAPPDTPPMAPPDTPPMAPPDTPPMAPPDTPPMAPPGTPPMAPPDTPPMAPPDTPPMAPPDTPPMAPPNTPPKVPLRTTSLVPNKTSVVPVDVCPSPVVPPDVPVVVAPLVMAPIGFEAQQLEIVKQHGKKGIGIILSSGGDYPVVKRLLANSAGGKCGLRVGDKIAQVDAKETQDLSSHDVMITITEAPKSFQLVVFRDPQLTSESTPSLSSAYGPSIAYTESVSSLLSDEGSGAGTRRPSLSSQLPLIQSFLEESSPSPLAQSRSLATPPPPPPPDSPAPSPPSPNTRPPQPSSPPPSLPPHDDPPVTLPPPTTPLSYPPPPTTPPPSPPFSMSKLPETFTVEVTKGLFSLGLTAARNDTDMVVVKAIASRSPLVKEGTLKVNDTLLSINGKDLRGLTDREIDTVIKTLPKGLVTITAASPSTRVAEAATSAPEDEGVVRVKLSRPAESSLGIIVEGGSDTALNNVYITSLKPGSAAFNTGQFQRGDQIVMCGDECLIGVSSLEAWDILTKAPPTVEFVLTRRKEVPALLGSGPTSATPTAQQTSRPHSLVGHKRRMSYSLHFSSNNPSMEDIRNAMDYDVEEDYTSATNKATPTPTQRTCEEYFTVVLNREGNQRLGFGIHGGADHPQLPGIYVKTIDASGIAASNGSLRRGDRLCAVNGHSLVGATRHEALQLLKSAGNMVTIETARQVTGKTSQSQLPSVRGSAETTPPACPSSGSPSPILRGGGMKGKRTTSIASRLGLLQTQGVKVVELHKGPTGLGMLLKGSRTKDTNVPITVKEVLPGGAAYKSGKISVGDELLEANSVAFEGLDYSEAVNVIKSLPQGTVRLVLLDRSYVIPSNDQ